MSFRRALKRFVLGAAEDTWNSAFVLLRLVKRPRVQRWHSPGGQCVWVVAPHPDDEVVGCCGAIGEHIARGDEVHLLFVTDGRQSAAQGLAPDAMAQTRRAESELAAERLNVRHVDWMGLHEGAWHATELVNRLTAYSKTFRPDIIYAPSRVDFHPEHQRVADALATALGAIDCTPEIVVYQIHVPLGRFLTNYICDANSRAEVSHSARQAYRTQLGSIERTYRLRRYAGSYFDTSSHTEAFWRMSHTRYIALHGPTPSKRSVFRGIREWAIGDPLAYLAGCNERRRIRL